MQKVFLPVLATLFVFATSIQASLSGPTERAEIEITLDPKHSQLLKKLIYILSEPNYHSKDNILTKDVAKILDYLGQVKPSTPEEEARVERGLKDIFEKIKDFIEKLTKKDGDKKTTRATRADDAASSDAGGAGDDKKEDDDDVSKKQLSEKFKGFYKEVKSSFMKYFGNIIKPSS